MSMLTRVQILILAKEVLAGKARSYVSAAHAFAQFLVDEEAEKRVTTGDQPTHRHPTPTIPLPFVADDSPSPCALAEGLDSEPRIPTAKSAPFEPDSDEVMPWDAAAKRILDLEPKTHPRLVGRIPVPFNPDTGVRVALPATTVDGECIPCAPHGVKKCIVCNRGGAA